MASVAPLHQSNLTELGFCLARSQIVTGPLEYDSQRVCPITVQVFFFWPPQCRCLNEASSNQLVSKPCIFVYTELFAFFQKGQIFECLSPLLSQCLLETFTGRAIKNVAQWGDYLFLRPDHADRSHQRLLTFFFQSRNGLYGGVSPFHRCESLIGVKCHV